MVFFFLAASRLCVCDICKYDYGSCELFKKLSLTSRYYEPPCLRSAFNEDDDDDDDDDHDDDGDEIDEEERDGYWDILCPNSFVAVANDSCRDSVWFIQIIDNNCIVDKPEPDSYGQVVINGVRFLKGNFLEKVHDGKDHIVYKKSDLVTYFYKETILRPFVPFVESRNGLKLMNHDYVDIIYHLEKNGYTPF